jgi:hypothetical protein
MNFLPSRPQSDGMIEKFNSTLETMLSAFVRENQRDWDEYVYLLMNLSATVLASASGIGIASIHFVK